MIAQREPLRQRRDLGQIVEAAFRLYTQNFSALFVIAMLVIPLGIASGIFQARIHDDNVQLGVLGLLFPLQLAVDAIANAAIIFALTEIEGGRSPGFSAAFDAALGRIISLSGSLLRVIFHVSLFAITVVGIPWGIQRFVRWLFVEQAVMLDGANAKEALSVSAAAVEGQSWRTLGCWLVIWLLTVLPVGIAGGVAVVAPVLLGSIIAATVAALVLPFFVTMQTMLYFDLSERKSAPPPNTLEPFSEDEIA